MNPEDILKKYYNPESRAFYIIMQHSSRVAEKALEIAERVKHLNPDFSFIHEAAMLHDIGMFLTRAPQIGCYGNCPYICHGYLGREVLDKEELPEHALVCERHVGVGITVGDIKDKTLPLPIRDMVPITIEEQIICFADKFFSKVSGSLIEERPLKSARKIIAGYGNEKLEKFDEWVERFKYS
jgi:uncharacterized protein